MQYMLVIGDDFAEQAGVGLTQEVVNRGQIMGCDAQLVFVGIVCKEMSRLMTQ